MGEPRRTSGVRLDIREIAYRAEATAEFIRRLPDRRTQARAMAQKIEAERGKLPGALDMQNFTGSWAELAQDLEEAEMAAALDAVVALLARWR